MHYSHYLEIAALVFGVVLVSILFLIVFQTIYADDTEDPITLCQRDQHQFTDYCMKYNLETFLLNECITFRIDSKQCDEIYGMIPLTNITGTDNNGDKY